jgi:hypothetical protein
MSIQFLWYTKLKPWYQGLVGIILALFSVIVLAAELINVIGIEDDIINNILPKGLDTIAKYIVAQVVCLIPLMYLMWAVNHGLFSL